MCAYLEFFQILCLPRAQGGKAIPRNQEMVLDVLLSDRLKGIKRALHDTFHAS